MASFDPIIRMNDNVLRGPEKMKSKAGRRPLGDVTNSSKLLGKNKGPEKMQPKAVRKPLGDLTNSQRPRAAQKRNYVEKVSAVNERKACSWVEHEGFLHNHDECIKAQRQSTNMSTDYFLETVGLKKDSCVSSLNITRVENMSIASDFKIEAPIEITEFEIDEMCAPASPPTPKAPGSPCWNMDWKDLNFSPVKLKESPVRN